MVGSPLFHSLCLSNKRQNFLPPVAVAQWSWQSPHSTVFIIIIAQTPVYGNCVLQKYKGRLPGGICRPLRLPEYYDIPGKPHGTHICVPYKPAGNLHFSQLYLAFRLFVGRGLDPSLPFCGNCQFSRRGGVTPPYGAIDNRCAVGAGHAPPATVYYNEYNGLVCRHGYYAARYDRPDITI